MPIYLSSWRIGAAFAGAACLGLGLIILLGWLLDVTALKSISPDWESMKVNTALGFAFGGAAVFAFSRRESSGPWWTAGRILALLPLALGILNLTEYAIDRDAGLNQLLFADNTPVTNDTLPGRMSAVTSLNFIIIGGALFLKGQIRPALEEAAAVVVAILGFIAILGYVYGVNSSDFFESLGVMALHTSVAFEVLAVGVLCLLPGSYILTVLLSKTGGGYLARRLVPAALLVPASMGYLRWQAEQEGLFGTEFGIALFAAFNAAFFVTLTLWLARSLDSAEYQRLHYEDRIAAGEARYAEILQVMQEMAYRIEWDAGTPNERHLTFLSEGVKAVLGYDREFMLANEDVWRSLRHPDDLPAMAAALEEALETDQLIARRYRFLHADGEYRWLEDRVRITRNAASIPVGYFGITRDISDLVRAEELEERARLAEDSERVRTRVLAIVSHELRTPLAGIRGFASLLSEYFDRLDQDEIQDLTAQINSGVDRMVKLTDDLLQLSRLDTGKIELSIKEVELNQLLTEIVSSARLRWTDQQIGMTVPDASLMVRADADRLRQIVDNLIDNAVKYAPGAPIEVAAEAFGPADALIRVSDKGPGVGEDDLTRIFEPFHRADGRNADTPGSGLGLAICKGLVEAHRGKIEASLPHDGGLTISVLLPSLPDVEREIAAAL